MFKVLHFNEAGDQVVPNANAAAAYYAIAFDGTILTYCLTMEAIELELEALRQAVDEIDMEEIARERTNAA